MNQTPVHQFSPRHSSPNHLPLIGLRVFEIAGGAAAAYCGRLLVDAGATVTLVAPSEAQLRRSMVRIDPVASNADADQAERAFADYLMAGKARAYLDPATQAFREMVRVCDLVLIGEDAEFDAQAPALAPRLATIALSWFGQKGEYQHWQGNDLIVQALTGLPQMAGAVDGPPIHAGDRQSTLVAGVTAYIAALAAALAAATEPQRLEISILEANMVLAEMHMHFFERDGIRMRRHGVNRFYPNSPVGVYPCQDGWVGITATTPEQWKSLCALLQMHEQARDERLMTRELRFERLDEVEQAMNKALAGGTALHWAELGRRHKVPIVVVPDAKGILAHPIFKAREALASFEHDGSDFIVPKSPFGLSRTPIGTRLLANLQPDDEPADAGKAATIAGAGVGRQTVDRTIESPNKPTDTASKPEPPPPLAGLTVIDFAMGWAGPLTGRLLSDLGADVIKIEAGRYPDWWRGVNWTAEYIQTRQYENAKGFCALNRGKRGVSIDLTTPAGRQLALSLIAGADLVVENQAAGVMAKLGLSYEQIAAANPAAVMVSMSAFGTGNAWSDTRAYGSTLEQGSGLPSFMGFANHAPTMYQLAYGDPVGGLFGCAAALTALIEKRRSGQGQYVNLSMVETMLQFTTPALLAYQLSGKAPVRKGNRHNAFAPHGIYPAAGKDQWLALSVLDDAAFARLAQIIGRPDWRAHAAAAHTSSGQSKFATLASRKIHEDEIDAAIGVWSRRHEPAIAARQLQAAGIAAAPIMHADALAGNAHLIESDFFIDLVREFSGPQRQAGIAIRRNGQRLGSSKAAPLLGEHSWAVLSTRAGVTREQFDAWVREGIITFAPTAVRNAAAI